MAVSDSQFTRTAGEHYVAFKLALLGLVPACVPETIRSLDLLATTSDGARSVAVQVETASHAAREGSETEPALLQFPLSQRALEHTAPDTIVCFVDLQARSPNPRPEVYVLTARQLREQLGVSRLRKYSHLRYARPAQDLAPFRENWQPLLQQLEGTAPEPLTSEPPAWAAEQLRAQPA